jgi:hypothetical protein
MPIIAPHRKRRRPTLKRVIEEASKAGKPVKQATITAEAVTVIFGEPGATENRNDLDQWIDKHAEKAN